MGHLRVNMCTILKLKLALSYNSDFKFKFKDFQTIQAVNWLEKYTITRKINTQLLQKSGKHRHKKWQQSPKKNHNFNKICFPFGHVIFNKKKLAKTAQIRSSQ